MTQDEAFEILKTGANVFLTGEPGSGKTHTVNRFVAWLKDQGIPPAVTASTGIAATHIGGMTIHSWSGIGVKEKLTEEDLDRITGNRRVVKRVRGARVLVIDEVSMLSAGTLDMIETVCRAVRGGSVPFGGLQVILVGDFFQLPPIVPRGNPENSENVENPENQLLIIETARHQDSTFAFDSSAWSALKPLVCYLSEQHRQEDPVFLELLSAVRSGIVSLAHREILKTRYAVVARPGVPQFFPHNVDVHRVNDAELAKLPREVHVFSMTSRGPEKLVAHLKRGCLSPETLSLKIGARVLFTKNDPSYRFVNGTLGTIADFEKENGYPIVKTNSGSHILAEPMEWSIEEGGHILARITQVPLRLAWAITVHKSQGMSMDAAHMDLSDVFEYGQGYVALSRVRTLAGLSLAGFNERALEVHPEIHKKDIEFRTASETARETIAKTFSRKQEIPPKTYSVNTIRKTYSRKPKSF